MFFVVLHFRQVCCLLAVAYSVKRLSSARYNDFFADKKIGFHGLEGFYAI